MVHDHKSYVWESGKVQYITMSFLVPRKEKIKTEGAQS